MENKNISKETNEKEKSFFKQFNLMKLSIGLIALGFVILLIIIILFLVWMPA